MKNFKSKLNFVHEITNKNKQINMMITYISNKIEQSQIYYYMIMLYQLLYMLHVTRTRLSM